MPIIPKYEGGITELPRAPMPGQTTYPQPGRGAEAPAIGLQIIGETLQGLARTGERFRQAQQAVKLSEAQVAITKDLTEFETSLVGRTDYEAFVPDLEGKLKEIEETHSQGLHNDTRRVFETELKRAAVMSRARVMTQTFQKTKEHGLASLETSEATLSTLLGQGDETRRQDVVNQYRIILKQQTDSGFITEEEAAKREAAFLEKADVARAMYDLRKDPKAFDPLNTELYPRLDPGARLSFSDQRERILERLANEAEQQRRIELREVLRGTDDELASVLHTGQEMGLLRRLTALDPEIAREYAQKLRANHVAGAIINRTRNQPLEIRLAQVEALKPAPGSSGFADAQQLYESVTRGVLQQEAQFQRDPAGYVAADAQEAAAGLVASGNERDLLQATVAESLALQRARGLPSPKVLAKEQGQKLKAQFESKDAEAKITMVQNIEASYGPYSSQALGELKLSPQHAFAATVANHRDPSDPTKRPWLPTARLLMQIADKKASDFEPGETRRVDVERDVIKYWEKTEFGAVKNGLAALLHEDPAMLDFVISLRDLATKTALFYVSSGSSSGDAAKRATEYLDDLYSGIADPDLGYVLFPKDHNKETIERGLKKAREALGDFLPGVLKETVEDLKNEGLWINRGQDFVLVNPKFGRVVQNKAGFAYRMTIEQVEAYGSTKKRKPDQPELTRDVLSY